MNVSIINYILRWFGVPFDVRELGKINTVNGFVIVASAFRPKGRRKSHTKWVMLLRRCGLQYRGVWKNALHQIREFLRYSCWKACRETPGRQKTHCHCSPQLLTTMVSPLPFHHTSRSLAAYLPLPPSMFLSRVCPHVRANPCRPNIVCQRYFSQLMCAVRAVHSIFERASECSVPRYALYT